MKVIIPAKSSSVRVPDKNWRPFHGKLSLVDIKLSQLLEVFPAEDIFVSCEDPCRRKLVESYGVHFLLRDEKLAADDTHWSDVVTGIVESIPDCRDDEDVAWVQLPCPLFGAKDFMAVWKRWQAMTLWDYDCIVTVEQLTEFLIDESGRPLNFQCGRWHATSQQLPKWYAIQRQCHIMQKQTYLRCNYDIGTRPTFYIVRGSSVDIDDQSQFEYAQYLYAKQ